MSDYDFSTLNDKDFEILVVELLSKEFNSRIERFKSGKDGGVDGRFFSQEGKEIIIQCKHWLKSGVAKLISSLESVELPKVKKINPDKYYVVTSLELSRANKEQIKSIFSSYMGNENYIYGKEDLNYLLRKYPEVERSNYKLWFLSTGVLENIFNADILGRSKYKLNEIKELNKVFVQTKNYEDAIHHLENLNSVIISGQPGIGKTTLAEQLCIFYLSFGFEFYLIDDSISEIEKIYKEEKKQIFLFDDFLGSNFLEVIEGKEDSKIVSFIRRIQKDKNKRFVLTSRTNILNQGRHLSNQFEISKINKNEFELHLDNYTELDKARILYNHIYFSDLQENYIEELYKDKRYKTVIKHKNFNPRLISFLTDAQRIDSSITCNKYWDYFVLGMNNPKDIWENVFTRQLNGISIDVIVAIVLNNNKINEQKLLNFFGSLKNEKYGSDTKLDFETVIRILVGSLLNRTNKYGLIEYSLFNPSIADYTYSKYYKDDLYIENIIIYLQSSDAINHLLRLEKKNLIKDGSIDRICNNLVSYFIEKDIFINDFNSLKIFSMLHYKIKFKEFLNKYLYGKDQYFVNLDVDELFIEHINLIIYMIENNLWFLNNDQNLIFINKYSDCIERMDYDELSSYGKLLKMLDINPTISIYQKAKKAIVDLCYDNIQSWVIDQDIFNHVLEEYEYDESELIIFLDKILTEFSIEFENSDIEHICSSFDIDDIIQSNQEAHADENRERENSGFKTSLPEYLGYIDPIEDLFDRG